MLSQFIDTTTPAWTENRSKLPKELPHGLISPPERVLEFIAEQMQKFPPDIRTPTNHAQIVNGFTLQYYFDGLGHEILYRPTPIGPEVLAVGFEEILLFTKNMCLAERCKLQTWKG